MTTYLDNHSYRSDDDELHVSCFAWYLSFKRWNGIEATKIMPLAHRHYNSTGSLVFVVLFVCLRWLWLSSTKSYTFCQSRQTCTTPNPSVPWRELNGSRVVSLAHRTTWRRRFRQCRVWWPASPWTMASRIFCRQCIWWNIATPAGMVRYISVDLLFYYYRKSVLAGFMSSSTIFHSRWCSPSGPRSTNPLPRGKASVERQSIHAP
jgi:hypothetical protein